LDFPPKAAWKRKSDMHTEEFIEKVYNKYIEAIALVEKHFKSIKVVKIDAKKELKQKITEVVHAVSKLGF